MQPSAHLLLVLAHEALALLWRRRRRDAPDALDAPFHHFDPLQAAAAREGGEGQSRTGMGEAGSR